MTRRHGWSVGDQNVRLQESRVFGSHWFRRKEGAAPIYQDCVRACGDPLATVTPPDGRVEEFRVKAEPECTPVVPQIIRYFSPL